jgi:uncharacterized protein YpiB (UPF0302 family)
MGIGKGGVKMKKRLVKKWINRYLKTLVEDLEYIRYVDYQRFTNITLINGEVIPEGNTYNVEYSPKNAIVKQAKGIIKILNEYADKKIYVRVYPEAKITLNQNWEMSPEHHRKNPKYKFYGVRMRFIVEK